MIVQNEYKSMLKLMNRKASQLDDKNLVDNIYALGKIHKSNRKPLNLPMMLQDYLEEVANRCQYLNHNHIAFLSKGLRSLRWLNVPGENKIRASLKERVKEISHTMDAYSISKFLSYLLTMNDIDHEVLPPLQDRLMELTKEGRVSELEIWDYKDILEVLSLTSQEKDHFIHRIQDLSEDTLNKARVISDVELKSSVVMDALVPFIMFKITKLESVSLPFQVRDLTEILY